MDYSVDNPLLKYDFEGILKTLKKKAGVDRASANTLDIITGDPQLSNNMIGFAELASRVQKQSAPMTIQEAEGVIGRLGYLAKEVGMNPKFFQTVMSSIGRENNLNRYLTSLGVKKLAAKSPKDARPAMEAFFKDTVKEKDLITEKLLRKKQGLE